MCIGFKRAQTMGSFAGRQARMDVPSSPLFIPARSHRRSRSRPLVSSPSSGCRWSHISFSRDSELPCLAHKDCGSVGIRLASINDVSSREIPCSTVLTCTVPVRTGASLYPLIKLWYRIVDLTSNFEVTRIFRAIFLSRS